MSYIIMINQKQKITLKINKLKKKRSKIKIYKTNKN